MSSLETVREILDLHGKLAVPADSLDTDDDLHAAGMSSHASVNVMLALEDALDVEFPDELLTKATFSTIGTIRTALDGLLEKVDA
jgi:acyl carrier protein